ncbi:ribonuclease J [Rickettsiales endosymbiont of Trichoplax sp. H2]|uniref:ribonuclease J n=1 Tax=Rickettsiales endosymbiont of Trichoplax sp. H2 TaxID=2021221 RepID=UPI0012B2E4AC|nr:ribonuclease J [Rickettsiales endosymbiont of Trichoplax sp. H2]MSO13443.1 Ribonuclease J [Rickettsiales endosymbiont of Trichoplax sp. H2]
MNSNINFKKLNKELIFIPLGGSGEIGMNLNLYHFNGKWIIVDLGLGFADLDLPGIDIIVPNINFIIKEIKKDILGIVLTHAHEDHIGAIQYLWSEIGCPIYATKFTSLIVKSKCKEYGLTQNMKFNEVESNNTFTLENFKISFIPITHSIPEMNGLLIETEKGKIFHTGDWKFDNEPVIGEVTDEGTLENIGKKGILALVGDSTNIFHKDHSVSEGELGRNLEKLLCTHTGKLIIITTFASNVARLLSMVNAAKKAKRKIILQGRSLWKMYLAAKEAGYLQDTIIYDEKHFKKFKRNEIVVICTGCQGESLAMTTKIADKKHPQISLQEDDVVIFSSKIIPGNEKNIYNLFNKLAEMNVNVLNEANEFVHVSGHPSAQEVKKMFKLIQPKIAIPVHGEAIHLNEHCRVAKNLGIKQALSVRNGDVIIFDNDEAKKIGKVESGYYIIDGNLILNSDSIIIKNRKTLRDNGALFISMIIDKKKKNINHLYVVAPGILEENLDQDILDELKLDIFDTFKEISTLDKNKIKNSIEFSLKKHIKKLINKSPLININIFFI